MDSKSNANKVWVTKLRHDIRIQDIDDTLSRHRLRASEMRLLPRGRAVLIFDQTADATSCIAQRDMFRNLGAKLGSAAFMMKYQPGYEDGAVRGQTNLIQAKLSEDVYELYSRSPDSLTSVTEQYKITWFYSTAHGLYLRGPPAAVKPAYDYLDNNILTLLDAQDVAEESADRHENGHREQGDRHQRNGDDRRENSHRQRGDHRQRKDDDHGDDRRENGHAERGDHDNDRREERPGTPEVEYAVVNKKKDRGKKPQDDPSEMGSHHRDAEHPRRREDRSPDDPRGRTPDVSLVSAPGYVKAYIRGVYSEDLNQMKSKYGVLFRDHPEGMMVEATDKCEPGWLRDACQELKSMNREVAGFVKETDIQLDRYGVSANDVESHLKDIEQSYPEILITRRHDNVLHMIGDENDLYKMKTTLLEAIQPRDSEERSRGKRDGHRRRDREHGRKRKEDRDRSLDTGGDDDSPRRVDDDRPKRGDRDRSRDTHLDDDNNRPKIGDRSGDTHLDDDYDRAKRGDRSRDRHLDDHDMPKRGDRSRDRHLVKDDDSPRRRDDDRRRRREGDWSLDKHRDWDYSRPKRRDKDRSKDRLDEETDRPRRQDKGRHANGDNDRPRKAHRERDREQQGKDRERPRSKDKVSFEYVFRKAGLTLTVQECHVLDQDTDAIVNPTDERMGHARGLSSAIAKEAGSRFRRECDDIVRKHGPLEVGDVTATGGGHLDYRYVLHVFGPKSGKHGSGLRDACRNVLRKCAKKNIASIAIPPIGPDTDNYARAMSDAIHHYVDHQTKKSELRQINLVDPDPKVVDILAREMDGAFNDDDSPDGRNPRPPPRRTGPVVMQPDGTVDFKVKKNRFLPGHNKHCTILVTYNFPAGVQGEEHPRPGRPYGPLNLVTYMPNSPEGERVARLLKRAFDQKLLFVFSETEGDMDKVLPRECVRHRTKTSGGPSQNGYPDPDYLFEVTDELAAIGIQ